MLAGLHGLLSGAIKSADKGSKADADAKALDIISRMDVQRIYYGQVDYDDADEVGTCKFAFNILRVNVVPDKYEFVLSNVDAPRAAEVEALGYLSPGDLKCTTVENPVAGSGVFNAVYSAPEEKYE